MKSGGKSKFGRLRNLPDFESVANDFRMFEVQALVATNLIWYVVKNCSACALTPFNSDPNCPSIVVESVVADHGAEIDEGLDAIWEGLIPSRCPN